MTRFQLVFQHPDGDRSELDDNSVDGESHINGNLIVDGATYLIKGVDGS